MGFFFLFFLSFFPFSSLPSLPFPFPSLPCPSPSLSSFFWDHCFQRHLRVQGGILETIWKRSKIWGYRDTPLSIVLPGLVRYSASILIALFCMRQL